MWYDNSMKKLALIISSIIFLSGLIYLGYIFRARLDKNPAGLEINTTPPASIYLDEELLGTSPYSSQSLRAGTYHLKLVPDSAGSNPLPTWEIKLELQPSTTTAINYHFAESLGLSSSTILQFERLAGSGTQLSVITEPDATSINLDGQPLGFSPLTAYSLSPGEHLLVLSTPGYQDQSLNLKAAEGYNLIVKAKLAASELVLQEPLPTVEPSPSASDSAIATPSAVLVKPYVVILETGTGWLRVRQEPSASATELGKANVGETLKYLGISSEDGWFKVEFEGSQGWVSGRYANLIK